MVPVQLRALSTDSEVDDFLHSAELLDQIERDISGLGYVGESRNKRLLYLVATSRRLSTPLSAVLASPPAAGKSELMKKVASLQPEEEIVELSRLTKQALYYMGRVDPYCLAHKFVTVAEAPGSVDANYSLRTLLSEKFLAIQTVKAGEPDRVLLHGPISYCEITTRLQSVNEETASRLFRLECDLTPSQTLRVQQSLASQAASVTSASVNTVVQRHQRSQRRLRTGALVVIPFAEGIKFPYHTEVARREFAKFLAVIQASAYLHQFQRRVEEKDGLVSVYAEEFDFSIARDLTHDIIERRLSTLPKLAQVVLGVALKVTERKGEGASGLPCVSRTELVGESGLTLRQVRYWLDYLSENNYLSVEQGSKGKEYFYSISPEGSSTAIELAEL